MKPSLKKSQSGQLLIEAVLLLTFVVGMWGLFSKAAKNGAWFQKMVDGPWSYTQGMIETGVWKAPTEARKKHPNSFTRVVSYQESP